MKTIVAIPDMHIPYHDRRALKVLLNAIAAIEPDGIVVLGDFIDAAPLSFHEKSTVTKEAFEHEIKVANEVLDQIDAVLSDECRPVFLQGNHEHRLERYLANKAPELRDLPNLSIPGLLGLRERGWEYFKYRDIYRVGKCHFVHDVGRCGKFAAAQSLADFGHNIVFGHSHRAQIHYGGNVRGESHVAMSCGWLGDYSHIDYRSQALAKREWQHGFGLIQVESRTGNCHMQFIPIIANRCVVGGDILGERM